MLKSLLKIRERVMGMNERNINLIYPHNDRVNYKYADDKYLAKKLLEVHGVSCPKSYAVVAQIGQIEQVWKVVKEWSELVIKPAKGAGGRGIMLLHKVGDVWLDGGKQVSEESIFGHIANIIFGIFSFGDTDVALIEEFIQPHPFFHKLYPKGVPDIRIILLKSTPILGMLRMPTSKSKGKANLHQGGLGIGIDLESGMLKEAYDGRSHITDHPDTHVNMKGRKIPHWEELVHVAIQATECFPLDFLGVDLVVDRDKGPMVMEVNVRPGLGIQLANKEGLKEAINNVMNT